VNFDLKHEIGRCVFREAFDAFLIVDPREACVVEVNPAAQRLTGLRRRQLLGMSLYDLFESGDAQTLAHLVWGCQSTAFSSSQDGSLRTARGGQRPVHIRVSRIHTEEANLGLVVVRAVTRRKRRAKRCRALADLASCIPHVLDSETGTFLWVGSGVEALTGFVAEQWTRPGFWRECIPLEYRTCVQQSLTQENLANQELVLDYPLSVGNQQRMWVRQVLRRDTTQPIWRGFLIDISDLKEQGQRRVRDKYQALDRFAGGMANELGNLLTSILGNAHLAQTQLPLDSPARPWIADLLRSAYTGAGLHTLLLTCLGQGSFEPRVVDLVNLVGTVQERWQLQQRRPVSLQMHTDTTRPTIRADEDQLALVLGHLFSNAAASLQSPEGAIHLQVRTCRLDQELPTAPDGRLLPAGSYGLVEICDNGCGLDEETARRMFDYTFSTRLAAWGLGLPLALGVMKQHGGGLTVQTDPGKGTTVAVFLPLVDPEETEQASKPTTPGRLRNRTILVVDEASFILDLIQRIMAREEAEVVPAQSIQEGLARFTVRADEVDVVLLDDTTAGPDYLAVYEGFRRVRADIPIVLLGGSAEEANVLVRQGILSGYAPKPFRVDSLVEELERVLST
jgi:PAS domain S-box-containing protein